MADKLTKVDIITSKGKFEELKKPWETLEFRE